MRSVRCLAAAAALVTALLVQPLALAAAPVAVTDDAGRTVHFARPPRRVISLAPSHTEVMYALGAEDRLAAVNEWSDYPPAARAKPQVHGVHPSLEQVVVLQPDLLLLWGVGDLLARFEASGFPVLVLAPRNLEGIYRDIQLLGVVMGAPDRARAVTTAMRDRVAAVRARVAGVRRPRVFYEVDATDPVRPFTVGPASFIHELLELAGGENVAAGAKAVWPQLSLEQLLKADPEIIILGDALSASSPQTPQMVMRRPGWERVTAVQRRAIYAVDGNLVSRPGPRIVEGLEALARILHPDRFARVGYPASSGTSGTVGRPTPGDGPTEGKAGPR